MVRSQRAKPAIGGIGTLPRAFAGKLEAEPAFDLVPVIRDDSHCLARYASCRPSLDIEDRPSSAKRPAAGKVNHGGVAEPGQDCEQHRPEE